MRVLTYRREQGLRLGVKMRRGVLDVTAFSEMCPDVQAVPSTIDELLAGGRAAFATLARLCERAQTGDDKVWLEEQSLVLGPCVPHPGKIICAGTNYRKHAEESRMPIPEVPLLFNKYGNTVAASGDLILLPANSTQVDYEAELVIVMGARARQVHTDDALDYVAGYCNGNDLSARDLQFRTHQWMLGKSCDGFCPLGPYLVTADEVGDPQSLEIRSFVNGELRQHATTSDMIFSCAELISYISHHMTLEPGDVIMTGTPAGVVFGYPPEKQVWLQAHDEVVIEVEKLGRLVNRMIQAV